MKVSVAVVLFCTPFASAFSLTCPKKSFVSNSRLFNVPAPSASDKVALKVKADREKPPQSFFELNLNCAKSAKLAIADGYKLIEVEVCAYVFVISEKDSFCYSLTASYVSKHSSLPSLRMC